MNVVIDTYVPETDGEGFWTRLSVKPSAYIGLWCEGDNEVWEEFLSSLVAFVTAVEYIRRSEET